MHSKHKLLFIYTLHKNDIQLKMSDFFSQYLIPEVCGNKTDCLCYLRPTLSQNGERFIIDICWALLFKVKCVFMSVWHIWLKRVKYLDFDLGTGRKQIGWAIYSIKGTSQSFVQIVYGDGKKCVDWPQNYPYYKIEGMSCKRVCGLCRKFNSLCPVIPTKHYCIDKRTFYKK